MFLWQFRDPHCTLTYRPFCINTIENAMSPAVAQTLFAQPLPPLSRVLLRLTLVLVTWDMRHRTRQTLRKLNDQMLSDIGLDPWAADTEAAKPFWRA